MSLMKRLQSGGGGAGGKFSGMGFDIKKMFFDRHAVTSAVDRATRRVLSRFGAFVRRTARSSIRKRKGISRPGAPPSSHTGLLKRFIYFGYDAPRRTVVIGPVALAKSDGEAPSLLEHGGTAMARGNQLVRVGEPGRDASGRFTQGKLKRVAAGTRMAYRPRPFMGPAMAKELPGLPEMWRNSVK